jgi:hypothetical protein
LTPAINLSPLAMTPAMQYKSEINFVAGIDGTPVMPCKSEIKFVAGPKVANIFANFRKHSK